MKSIYLTIYDFHHPPDVFIRQRRSGRQAKTYIEQMLRSAVPIKRSFGKYGLQMHRFPQGSALDIIRIQRQTDIFPGTSRHKRVDGNASQPEIRIEIRGRILQYTDSGGAKGTLILSHFEMKLYIILSK